MDAHLTPVVPRATSAGRVLYEGISFALLSGYRPLLLDLHVPDGRDGDAVPVVIWLHGGGFHSGDRRYLPDTMAADSVFAALVEAGIAVATIDYRLSSEARFPAQLDDVNAALDYLRSNAALLGLDPERIGVWGESAGGTLAALVALTTEHVSAAVLWYPPTDLAASQFDSPDSPVGRLIGGAPSRLPSLAAQASPIAHVSTKAPPFLLLHGTADESLSAEHSRRMHARLLEAGARSTYRPVRGAGHGFVGCDDIPGLIATSVAFLSEELRVR
jgi:acetyl esterase/lipase